MTVNTSTTEGLPEGPGPRTDSALTSAPVPSTIPESSTIFGQLHISYDERVLQPRLWTLEQSEWSAELMITAPTGPVLELCCGAGQIGLAAINKRPRGLVAIDVNPVACHYTRRNADNAHLGPLVEVRVGRFEEVLDPDETFAVIIADPPWVPRGNTGLYPDDPFPAINGGADGLDVVWACVQAASRHLMPGGSAILQLGTISQAERVDEELATYGQLKLTEVRLFEHGALIRLDQPLTPC